MTIFNKITNIIIHFNENLSSFLTDAQCSSYSTPSFTSQEDYGHPAGCSTLLSPSPNCSVSPSLDFSSDSCPWALDCWSPLIEPPFLFCQEHANINLIWELMLLIFDYERSLNHFCFWLPKLISLNFPHYLCLKSVAFSACHYWFQETQALHPYLPLIYLNFIYFSFAHSQSFKDQLYSSSKPKLHSPYLNSTVKQVQKSSLSLSVQSITLTFLFLYFSSSHDDFFILTSFPLLHFLTASQVHWCLYQVYFFLFTIPQFHNFVD